MSYCRFGSDNGKSDVYALKVITGGFEIYTTNEDWHVETLQEFKDKLLELRKSGLHVPQAAFDRIEYELK